MKYLTMNVYRSDYLGDCTNEGVSSEAPILFIQHPQGPIDERFVPVDRRFKLVSKDPDYLAAVPVYDTANSGRPLFGGNLLMTADSRSPGILHIHDRYETRQDQYMG